MTEETTIRFTALLDCGHDLEGVVVAAQESDSTPLAGTSYELTVHHSGEDEPMPMPTDTCHVVTSENGTGPSTDRAKCLDSQDAGTFGRTCWFIAGVADDTRLYELLELGGWV